MANALKMKDVEKMIAKEENALQVPLTLKLVRPVAYGEETIEEVVVEREPTAGDFAQMPLNNQTFDDYYGVMSKMIGRPRSVIEKMSGVDARVLMGVANYFFGGSEPIGEGT